MVESVDSMYFVIARYLILFHGMVLNCVDLFCLYISVAFSIWFENQRTNGPINARLISELIIST